MALADREKIADEWSEKYADRYSARVDAAGDQPVGGVVSDEMREACQEAVKAIPETADILAVVLDGTEPVVAAFNKPNLYVVRLQNDTLEGSCRSHRIEADAGAISTTTKPNGSLTTWTFEFHDVTLTVELRPSDKRSPGEHSAQALGEALAGALEQDLATP